MSRVTWAMPRRIAAQIIWMVTLSAVIFHICMSAAFVLARESGLRPPGAHDTMPRLSHHVNLIEAAGPASQAAVMDAVERTDPDLGIAPVTEPEGTPAPVGAEAVQIRDRVRPGIDVGRAHDGSGLRIRLRDGSWLVAATPKWWLPHPNPSTLLIATLFFIALSTTIFVLWAIRSITLPLGRFAEAVDAFALDGNAQSLAETGPTEIVTASRAFNRMQARIAGMMAQRTQMLASVSHDLRTPITRLRLRAEYVGDEQLRTLMLRDLKQMDGLVHSALSFIRDRVVVRAPARLDLASLLRTICDEFSDLGCQTVYRGPDHVVIDGHEDELRRAVTNLVENAASVGAAATVGLSVAGGGVEVTVDDDGPGIPPAMVEDMLQPFRRGPDERNGGRPAGFGLGLPIVQAIVHNHGGTLTIANRKPRGLRCRIVLPTSEHGAPRIAAPPVTGTACPQPATTG